MEYIVISIGTLSFNRLWGEAAPMRTAHATTTLVIDGDRRILIDPSLPAVALAARLNERTGLAPSDVTDIFCTTLRPVHRRSVEAFEKANWWTSQIELESYSRNIENLLDSADRLSPEDASLLRSEQKLIGRFSPAPDSFSKGISLYPLAGPSEGSAGLLLTPTTATIIIAGDAAITRDHIQRGQVWQGCSDTQEALESLSDLLEIADVIIPGHDNLLLSPQRFL